ncbi:sensor histidine kinase [Anaeroselena agilis]|uniref:histidine kinase n=1 Tax=Anaeroselena agilis TaxID=3063788 RepID=A0ABU3P405_9FIRM|nr:ATP-binding protein [Selenomonadales bacterium 4137-cl]
MAKTLQTKITLILLAVFLLTLSVNVFITGRIFRAEYTGAVEGELFAVGQGLKVQVERLLGYGLPFSDIVGFDELCTEVVKKYPDITYAAVVDTNGAVLFHSNNSDGRIASYEPELNRAVGHNKESVVRYSDGGREMFGFVVPVAEPDGRHVGAVVLGYPEENIADKVAALTGQNAAVSFLQFGVALVMLGLFLSLWVTKPLVKLQRATENIVAQGTEAFQPVEIRSQDEIGRLADSFNEMAADLQKTTVSKARLEEALSQLQHAQSQLVQQEKLVGIGQLAAGVAHEINNPMAYIISNLESLRHYTARLKQFVALQEAALADLAKAGGNKAAAAEVITSVDDVRRSMKIDHVLGDTEELIRETLDGAAKVKHIVQDLQGYARSDQIRKMANINDGIAATVNVTGNELKNVAVVSLDLGELPLTRCNPGQLNQVFMNLLVNAAQAIDAFGEIHIKTWAHKDNIFISIADSGRGIAAKHMNRIFEPFFTTKEVGKGTGLGLSVCYDIVRNHGGVIKVESEEGKGTTVTVVLPVVRK